MLGLPKVTSRRMLVALTLLGVATAAAVGVLAQPHQQVASAAGARSLAIAAPRQHVLLFVGASYTASLGATSPAYGYASQVAAQLGWPAHIYAVAGAGYLNPGPRGTDTFAEQIRRLPTDLDPGLMIVQGGRNDGGYPSQQLRTAACAAAEQLRQKYAGGQVVLLGNVPFSQTVTKAQRSVEHALATAGHDCHVPFIDPIAEAWITHANAQRLLGPVSGHPNDAGYRYIAERLVTDLGTLSQHRIGRHVV